MMIILPVEHPRLHPAELGLSWLGFTWFGFSFDLKLGTPSITHGYEFFGFLELRRRRSRKAES